MPGISQDRASQPHGGFDQDLFEPLVGMNVWSPRIGFALMTCVLTAGLFLSGSRGGLLLFPVILIVAAGFELVLRFYRHGRKVVCARGRDIPATIVQKKVTPRGNLHKLIVEIRGYWGVRKASVYVSSGTYNRVTVGERLEVRCLPASVYWIIPPVPIRRLP